ncbi:MAG: N-acetylglucosamine-6-phosphate deacetylase [Alphaproteobacteria bacterium]|nr:N-acetylglucosamine-6-phosphate deacetylase [Alphaproteobacteria bacterium]
MTDLAAISAPSVFDGELWHRDSAVLHENGQIKGILPVGDIAETIPLQRLDEGHLVPGFVDLQVNGGGGALLNDDPTVEAIETICRAHAPYGTTALLPTLITDTPEMTRRAVDAAKMALERPVAGCLGLHLEGPHLSKARRGAHDPQLIREAMETDIVELIEAARGLDNLLVTMAPESVSTDQVRQLVAGGVRVSLGHSAADYGKATAMIEAGAHMVTHLFNAMSPLGHREPGVVGAALETGSVYAGLIADGYHVDPATMAIALRAKRGPGKIFLVTDAMSTIGTDLRSITLNGREITRADGRLTLADGTLAGADIDMISSVRVLMDSVGLPLDEALRMASLYPAEAMGVSDSVGSLKAGRRADFVQLTPELEIGEVWICGNSVHRAKTNSPEI